MTTITCCPICEWYQNGLSVELIAHIKDCNRASRREAILEEREGCLATVTSEPELPGPMPDEVWVMSKKVNLEQHLRGLVRCVKAAIAKRIEERV